MPLPTLTPHPEGGSYAEVFRSPSTVSRADASPRSALTAIYFQLLEGAASAWHRVASDEVWHHVEGAPLTLWLASPDFSQIAPHSLGPLADGHSPFVIVPATWWQATAPATARSLCSCFVAPGFDFADFALLRDHPSLAAQLTAQAPHLTHLLAPETGQA